MTKDELIAAPPVKRECVRFFADLPECASWIVSGDFLIIAHPNHPPRLIRPDGTEVDLTAKPEAES